MSREASGQIAEYYGLLKSENIESNIELVLCANIIPNERRIFLEAIGISCKEIPENRMNEIAKKYNIKLSNNITTANVSLDSKQKWHSSKYVNNGIKSINSLYEYIKLPEGKEIIATIIKVFESSGKYKGDVENKVFNSYRLMRIHDNELIYDFAFIVNRHDLLFYIRKPAESFLSEQGKLPAIKSTFALEKPNRKAEITIRIKTLDDANNLCNLILQ